MTILIAGATGLIGQKIVELCKVDGIRVNYLTTSREKIEKTDAYNGYYWNPAAGEIDVAAFKNVSAIINLAGATIAKRWSNSYKKVILTSRIQAAKVLFDALKSNPHDIRQYISASGVSIYPSSREKLYSEENDEIDSSFLAEVVVAWEDAADSFNDLGMEVTKVRTGVVLAEQGGALTQIVKPIKMGLGSALGDGKQWLSWIHIEDIARMYLFMLDNQLEGIYNAVAPSPITNKKITKKIAQKLGKPLWLPAVPSFILKLILGEMSILVLEGQIVSSQKIEEQGFKFHYTNIEGALKDLLN